MESAILRRERERRLLFNVAALEVEKWRPAGGLLLAVAGRVALALALALAAAVGVAWGSWEKGEEDSDRGVGTQTSEPADE